MAEGDFTYCQADLASLISLKLAASLPANELAQLKAVINEAYRECFIRPDGRRVRWAEEYLSFLLPAPVTFTFTATNGLTSIGSVSGVTLLATYAGSRILIGTDYYTLASATALLEPWSGTTGPVTATIYYNSYVLPVENIDIAEEPEVLGWGRLSPMSGVQQEIRNRSYGSGDFVPERGETPKWAGFGQKFQVGDPLFYYVDNASLVGPGAATSVQNRFNVYPLPDNRARTVRLRGNYVPSSMTADADVPRLPANAIIDTMLPIARAKFVSLSRRFNGNNRAEIIALGQLAEGKLNGLGRAQKRQGSKLKMKEGW